MKRISALLLELSGAGIELWVEDGDLCIDAPEDALTDDLTDQLRARKPEILAFFEKATERASTPELPPIRPVPRDQPLPLSFNQQRLWLINRLAEEDTAYNLPTLLGLAGPFAIAEVERSFHQIIPRHEPLRTVFSMRSGTPVQIVSEDLSFSVSLIDLAGLTDPEAGVVSVARAEIGRPFDLEKGPLIRVHVLRTAPRRHLLVILQHHIVSDALSMGIMVGELTARYEALVSGRPRVFPELPIQYADFAHWQRETAARGVFEKQIAFWQRQLAGAPPLLELPTDRPRPPVQTTRGASLPFEIPTTATARLHRLGRQTGATLFMVLHGVLSLLMSRYTGSDDICIGTPTAGRGRPEIEPLIGFFVNTLVLRVDLSGNPTLASYMERVRKVALDAFANQDIPFEEIVALLSPEHSLSHTPFFQVMCSLQPDTTGDLTLPGLSPIDLAGGLGTETSKLDLMLYATETDGMLSAAFEYNTDLFDTATIARMSDHLRILIDGLEPDRPIHEIPLMDAAEETHLLESLNRGPIVPRPPITLLDPFRRMVAEKGAALALIEAETGTRLTCSELDRHAERLAGRLRRRGLGPEQLIGICCNRSIDMMIGLFAILKAGAAYVPLDPTYPDERLGFMIEDAALPLVLVGESQAARFDGREVSSLVLDHRAPVEPVAVDSFPPEPRITPRNAVYAIYTSGSTGTPKGTLIEHHSVVNRLSWMPADDPLSDTDVLVQKTPISFDVSVWELFWWTFTGGSLCLSAPGDERDPAALSETIAVNGVTTAHFVPSMFDAFLGHLEAEPSRTAPLVGLRRIFTSGEALTADQANRCRVLLPESGLHNLYGPTEAGIEVTAYPCPPEPLARVPIGKPIDNLQIHILDRRGALQPIGVPGLLHIAGEGLSRGYAARAGLTASKFLPNPFCSGARMYDSGDLARWLPDGTIEYLGRVDHQVKLRGFRIELGEIESALDGLEGVAGAVVAVRDERLVAYVRIAGEVPLVTPNEPDARIEVIRAGLMGRLPEYMVPSLFIVLETFPLSEAGKIDRRALPDPAAYLDQVNMARVAPRTDTERRLHAIWQSLLRLENIGIHDNFFALGGHSLKSVQLMTAITEAFETTLTPAEVFASPTIARMAEALDRKAAEKAERRQALLRRVKSMSREETLKLLAELKKEEDAR